LKCRTDVLADYLEQCESLVHCFCRGSVHIARHGIAPVAQRHCDRQFYCVLLSAESIVARTAGYHVAWHDRIVVAGGGGRRRIRHGEWLVVSGYVFTVGIVHDRSQEGVGDDHWPESLFRNCRVY